MSQRQKSPTFDMILAPEHIAFDVEAFDSLLASHGVVFEHYRSIICPLGITDRYDARSHSGHSNCSNGYIYKKAGTITAFFSQNQTIANIGDIGSYDGSTVQVTLPRYYDNEEGVKEVLVQPFDRFFMKDVPISSVNTQRFEAHQSGIDRLQYSVTDVEHLIDANGIEYEQNIDFVVENGNIKWLGSKRPGYDPVHEKGTICAIRYHYTPFFYVKQLLHEVRVSRDLNIVTGDVSLVRMPHAVLLQREYCFESAQRDSEGKNPINVNSGPRDGGFGPR